jgi:glycosyltransferase involved in cell wall biosynthesis
MRLLLTLLVRDEIDIVRSCLDFHLAEGIDHILVTDNGSRDGTAEVLAEYALRGDVTVLHEPPADFSQHRWVTRMARMACTDFGADWVINADADEAFACRHGSLRDALRAVPDDVHALACERTDFVAFERQYTQPPPLEMVYRKKVSLNLAGRPLSPKIVHRAAPDVVVGQGNHRVQGARFSGTPGACGIEVFHYPVRSLAQFESKVCNAGSGYARNRELSPGQGFHKRRWYAQWLAGELPQAFEAQFFGPERLAAALASDELCLDRTIADRIATLSPPETTCAEMCV